MQINLLKKFSKKKFSPVVNLRIGAFFFCLSGLAAVSLTIFGKKVMKKTGFDPMFLMAMRYILLFFLVLPLMIRDKFEFLKDISNLKSNIIKDVLSTLATLLWYKSIVMVPINNGITIAFLTPIFVILLDAIFFKHKIKPFVMLGILISFYGVAIVSDFKSFDISNQSIISYLLIILVAIIRSVVNIMSRTIVANQGVKNAFYTGLLVQFLVITFLFIFKFSEFQSYLNVYALLNVLIISLMFGVHFSSFLISVKFANLSWLQPFDFMRILFSIVISYIVLGETISIRGAIGMVFIISGVTLSLSFGNGKQKKN